MSYFILEKHQEHWRNHDKRQ